MTVQVSLRAEKLGNIVAWSRRLRGLKSDPYATISFGEVEVGRTEFIQNELSPVWTTITIIEHDSIERDQAQWTTTPLKITIRDHSRNRGPVANLKKAKKRSRRERPAKGGSGFLVMSEVKDDAIMGEATVEVGEVLQAKGQEMRLNLSQGGCIYVCITERYNKQSVTRDASLIGAAEGTLTGWGDQIHPNGSGQKNSGGIAVGVSDNAAGFELSPTSTTNTGVFHCHLRALDLQNIEQGLFGLGAIDPYYEIAKRHVDHDHGVESWIPVYRSERLYNIVNPHWNAWKLQMEKLCNGDAGWELQITVWDYEGGKHVDRWIGACEKVSVDELLMHVTKGGNASREEALSILNEEQEEVGLIVVLKADILLE